MTRFSPILVCCLSLAFSLPAADWQVSLASLWGGAGDQAFEAGVVTGDGVAVVGGNGQVQIPGVPVHEVGSGDGVLLRIDTLLGEVLSITRLGYPVTDICLDQSGEIFVSAGVVYKFPPACDEPIWQGGSGGQRLAADGAGGVWSWRKGQAEHIDAQGQVVGSVGLKGKDFAVDPVGKRLFVCGFNAGRSKKSGNPVHVPYIRAYDWEGQQLWQMWGFSPTEVDEVGDMADSHPQRLCFGADGYLYMFGDSDGGNTAYRHSPHEPGGSLGSALKGTAFNEMWKAFRSVRMLFVCRIDPENGDIVRGSFFYGKFFNTEANREEIGDGQALGLHADKDGRVFLAGVMRCQLPWTPNAVHRQSAPMDRSGYWKNLSSTDEGYLTVIDEDFSNLAFCSGFNQGDSGTYHSRMLDAGGNAGAAVVVGYMQQPEQGGDPASATAYLKNPLQPGYGGGKDAYVATLSTRRPPTDPVALVRLLLDRVYPTVSGTGIETLRSSTDFGKATEQLRSVGDVRSAMVADMVERVGRQTLERAEAIRSDEPVVARSQYEQLIVSFAGSAVAQEASARLEALEDDKELRELIKANEDKIEFLELVAELQTPEGTEESFLDAEWLKENRRVLKKMQRDAQAMMRRWEGHRYTEDVLAICSAYQLPVTELDLELLDDLELVRRAHKTLPSGKRRAVDWSDEGVRRRYRRALEAIEEAATRMTGTEPTHPYSVRARLIADGVGIEVPVKKRKR